MLIEHNSRQDIYRYPKGAVKCDTAVRIRVTVGSYSIPSKVSLIVNDEEIAMYFVCEIAQNRIYECSVKMPESAKLVWYYFYVEADGERAYYGNNIEGLGGIGLQTQEKCEKLFQITVYDKDFKTPDWIKNAIVYQIFPDRFYRGAETVFHGIQRNWGEMPYYKAEQFGGQYLSNDFFGGTLYGIAQKLSYLKELGINAIYMNPIFKAYSNHRYDTGDYEEVDSTLGGNKAFDYLIDKAKEYGIKIILDGVFSHTGADSKYFNCYNNYASVGAYQSKDSIYYNWYMFKNHPNEYDSWWGFKTLPNVNEMNADYMEFILKRPHSVVKKWIEKGASGWRLDVADELPDEFIKELRKAVKSVDEEAVVIGEVWEDASNKISYGEQREFLWGSELDSVMNYVLRSAILEYLTEKSGAELFVRRLLSMKENYPKEALYSALNLISSHDVPRALTVLSDAPDVHKMTREQQANYVMPIEKVGLAKKRLRLAALLQMTLPGAPCVYYGDEAGMVGYTDPFNRGCFPWGNQDEEITGWYKEFISIRKKYPALVSGDFTPLFYYDNVVCYKRDITDGKDVFNNKAKNQSIVVIINADSKKEASFELELGRFNVKSLVDIFTDEKIYLNNYKTKITLQAMSYKVLLFEKEDKNAKESNILL